MRLYWIYQDSWFKVGPIDHPTKIRVQLEKGSKAVERATKSAHSFKDVHLIYPGTNQVNHFIYVMTLSELSIFLKIPTEYSSLMPFIGQF